MAEPLVKTRLILFVDFLIGAVGCDLFVALIYLRLTSRRYHVVDWHWSTFWVCLVATTLIAGSLGALHRDWVWGGVETYKVIPPIEEAVNRRDRIVLWIIFALGCLSLGGFFIF